MLRNGFLLTLGLLWPGILWALTELNVLLEPALRQVEISGYGLVISTDDKVITSESNLAKTTFLVTVNQREWVVRMPGDQAERLAGPNLVIKGLELKLSGQVVPDFLMLSSHHEKRIQVVAKINIEAYLKGVLPSEMPASWPLEALKAQAVAARSFALATRRERAYKPYHLDGSTNYQVFSWQNFKGLGLAHRDKVIKAVEDTEGEYLSLAAQEGVPYKTYYHAHCGGKTEEPSSVWQVGAKNGITQDEHCLVDKKSAWELKVPIDEIKTKLNLDKDVKDIQPIHFTASLRNEILRVTLSDGSYKDISAQGMRSYLGFSKLKSAAFKVERQSDNFLFTGRGYGHGAGLCQSGTRFMALGGANYKEILAKYFPRAQIVRKTQTVALKP